MSLLSSSCSSLYIVVVFGGNRSSELQLLFQQRCLHALCFCPSHRSLRCLWFFVPSLMSSSNTLSVSSVSTEKPTFRCLNALRRSSSCLCVFLLFLCMFSFVFPIFRKNLPALQFTSRWNGCVVRFQSFAASLSRAFLNSCKLVSTDVKEKEREEGTNRNFRARTQRRAHCHKQRDTHNGRTQKQTAHRRGSKTRNCTSEKRTRDRQRDREEGRKKWRVRVRQRQGPRPRLNAKRPEFQCNQLTEAAQNSLAFAERVRSLALM